MQNTRKFIKKPAYRSINDTLAGFIFELMKKMIKNMQSAVNGLIALLFKKRFAKSGAKAKD